MASIDLALLRVIKNKVEYDKVFRYIPLDAVNKRTALMAKSIGKYFENNETETLTRQRSIDNKGRDQQQLAAEILGFVKLCVLFRSAE